MGYSPGDFQDESGEVHWEGGGNGDITLWNKDETKSILRLSKENARKGLDQLRLLVDMAEGDAL